MPYLTRQQAIEYLHTSSTQMSRLTTEHRIPFYQERPGAKMFFAQEDLDTYWSSKKVIAPEVTNPYQTYRKQRAKPGRSYA